MGCFRDNGMISIPRTAVSAVISAWVMWKAPVVRPKLAGNLSHVINSGKTLVSYFLSGNPSRSPRWR